MTNPPTSADRTAGPIAAASASNSAARAPQSAHENRCSSIDVTSAVGRSPAVLDGYKGGADARLAVESGEVDGYCGSWQTVETVWRSAYESGKIRAILQASLEPYSKYKDVPLAISYAKTDLARQLVTVADSAHGAQFPYTVPPG